jgi:hypothetical protein
MFVVMLAFNRMMVFINARIADRLFGGAKAYVCENGNVHPYLTQ